MKKLVLLATVLSSVSFAAHATETKTPDDDYDYLSFNVGQFEAFDDNDATQFGMEYRFKPVLWQVVRPVVGGFITTDTSLYGYAGVDFDFQLCNKLYLTPHTAVGAYDDNEGKDLGGTVEFRSGIELSYELPNQARLGLDYNHISNASIYDRNPGAETLLLTYSLPLGR